MTVVSFGAFLIAAVLADFPALKKPSRVTLTMHLERARLR